MIGFFQSVAHPWQAMAHSLLPSSPQREFATESRRRRKEASIDERLVSLNSSLLMLTKTVERLEAVMTERFDDMRARLVTDCSDWPGSQPRLTEPPRLNVCDALDTRLQRIEKLIFLADVTVIDKSIKQMIQMAHASTEIDESEVSDDMPVSDRCRLHYCGYFESDVVNDKEGVCDVDSVGAKVVHDITVALPSESIPDEKCARFRIDSGTADEHDSEDEPEADLDVTDLHVEQKDEKAKKRTLKVTFSDASTALPEEDPPRLAEQPEVIGRDGLSTLLSDLQRRSQNIVSDLKKEISTHDKKTANEAEIEEKEIKPETSYDVFADIFKDLLEEQSRTTERNTKKAIERIKG